MKAIKIIIVAVLAAALGFGIYIIIKPREVVSDDDERGRNIVIPDGCDLEWDQQYIDSVYKSIPNGQFQTLKKRRSEMTANYNSVMTDSPQKCKETVDLILRNRYQSRFIAMANSEFEGKSWPHYSDIRNMNKGLLSELSQGSSDLKRIEKICNEYGQVAYYNSKVRSQSQQRPSSISDHWNFSNTKDLINSTPLASEPVDHTAQYEASRLGHVKSLLYGAHVAFLNKLVELARQEIKDNNTESHYNSVFDTVTKEIEKFKTIAESLYGKSYSSVNSTAESLTKEMKSYESLVNEQKGVV